MNTDPNTDPRQTDPQYQSPLADDSEQASQLGMGGQPDSPLLRQGTLPQTPGEGQGQVDHSAISIGTDVLGSDDRRVGTVQDVYEDSILVQKGIFFVHDYFIPYNYIASADNDRIMLTLTADEAKRQDWAQRPSAAMMGHGAQAEEPGDTAMRPPGTDYPAGDRPESHPEMGQDLTDTASDSPDHL